MIELDDKKYICKYRYEDSNEEFQIESDSIDWLKDRLRECSECGKKVYYKIHVEFEQDEIESID